MATKATKKELKGEVTTVTTIRITSISKVDQDEDKAKKVVDTNQKKLFESINNLPLVDNMEIINERRFPNLNK